MLPRFYLNESILKEEANAKHLNKEINILEAFENIINTLNRNIWEHIDADKKKMISDFIQNSRRCLSKDQIIAFEALK